LTTTLSHRFTGRGAAREVFRRRDGEVLLAGPAGTGKSRACLEKLHMMMLLNPGAKALIVRKTAISLASSALKTWERDVVAEALLDGSVWFYGGSAREPAQYRYSNGSSVAIGGMDKALKIMSTEYDVIYAQEATELVVDDWEAMTTRLRNYRVSFQQLLADCNPDHPTHFLKQRADAGKTVMLHSRHEDNPMLFDDEGNLTEIGKDYLGKLDALTGVRKLRLRDGLWAASEGVIYETFDPALHIIDEMPPGWEHWPTEWAVDFGYTNPFVWQEWVIDPDGRGYLVQEIYRTKTLVEDHAKDIISLTKNRPRPTRIICDHDAEDRATLERHLGMRTVAANKNVSEGIQATASRFKLAGDGKPRLSLLRGACARKDQSLVAARKPTCTAEEIPGYIWNAAKDQPVKENDHGCDGMRYFVAEHDLTPVTRVRTRR
jgi:phage terminase large subunit